MPITPSPWTIVGVAVIASGLLFDVAWFSYREDTPNVEYEVGVTPSAEGEYRLTLPTVVDGDGVELDAMRSLTTSVLVVVAHVETELGPAIEVTASGDVTLEARCDPCAGLLSLGEHEARVQSNATENFTLSIRFEYSHFPGGTERNIFGRTVGGYCGPLVRASGSIPSNSNWTILEGQGGVLCVDYFSGASLQGILFSIPFYVIGPILMAVGETRRRRRGPL